MTIENISSPSARLFGERFQPGDTDSCLVGSRGFSSSNLDSISDN